MRNLLGWTRTPGGLFVFLKSAARRRRGGSSDGPGPQEASSFFSRARGQCKHKMRPLVISCDTEEGVRRRARINFEHDVLSATLPETLPAEWLARYGSSVYGAGERTRLAIMACFHSHLRVWQRVVGSESGVLVVEDDALWLPSAAPLPEAFPRGRQVEPPDDLRQERQPRAAREG